MPAVNLKAHYDGEQIVLDEPFDLPVNAPLVVTVLPTKGQEDRDGWRDLAARGLARAYGDNEPEYSEDDLKS